MRAQYEMPESGQFVAVWEHNDRIWSATMKYDDYGDLIEYCPETDDWHRAQHFTDDQSPVFLLVGDMG